MKPIRHHRLLLSVCILGFLSATAQDAPAQPTWQAFQMTSGNVFDVSSAVDGTTYVWKRGLGGFGEIFMWSEGDPTPVLISKDTDDFVPGISSGRVVWEHEAFDYEIEQWENGVVTQVTDNAINDRFPDISGNNLVWVVGNDSLIYDNGLKQIPITAGLNNGDEYPRVGNDLVVWEATTNGGSSGREIFKWRDGVVEQLTSNGYSDVRPETDGTAIVWSAENGPGGTSEIMRWTEAAGTIQLTNNSVFDTQPDVSGPVVVFIRFDGNDFEVFFRFAGVDYQITDNTFNDFEPAIDGTRVVWDTDMGGGIRHLYYAILDGVDGGDIAGACCNGLTCTSVVESQCSAGGGLFIGPDIQCDTDTCPASVVPANGWSTSQHDMQRTGRTSAILPNSPQLDWSLFVGEPFADVSPVIGPDGTIYVPGNSDLIVAVNPDGTLKWQRSLIGVAVFAPPTIRADGHLWLARQRFMDKIDPLDGSTVCSRSSIARVAPALLQDGSVVLGGVESIAADCQPRWSAPAGDDTSHVALATDGNVVVSTEFSVIKLDPSNGSEIWSMPTLASTGAPAIGADGTIYVHVAPDSLLAINSAGTEQWNFAYTDLNFSNISPSPAIGLGGTIYFVSQTAIGSNPVLVAVSSTGSELWRYVSPTGFDPFAPVVDGAGIVLFSAKGTDVVALDPVDGSVLWTIDPPGGDWASSSPAIDDNGTIYLTSNDGFLLAYNANGCLIASPITPPFDYRVVAQQGDQINGLTIQTFVDFEVRDDGLVSFEATITGSSQNAVFLETDVGVFSSISNGTVVDGYTIDDPVLPRLDVFGNRYMIAQVLSVGPAIFVNDVLYLAETGSGAVTATVFIDEISSSRYIDHDDLGRFLFLGRDPGDFSNNLYSVDSNSGSIEELLSGGTIIGGFQINGLGPEPVDGYANDGVPVLQASNGQFAIVTPEEVLVQTGDTIDGFAISHVRSPRRTEDGLVYFLGAATERNLFSRSPEGVRAFERGAGDTVAGQPVIEIEEFGINEARDIAFAAAILGGEGVFLNDAPIAIANISEIDGLNVIGVGQGTLELVSINEARQVGFFAQTTGNPISLFLASPNVTFDSDSDGDVDTDDYNDFDDCFSGEDTTPDDDCACLPDFDANYDTDVDCGDWGGFKQAWTGAAPFPPLFLQCDLDCNGNNVADDLDISSKNSPDANANGIPDECDTPTPLPEAHLGQTCMIIDDPVCENESYCIAQSDGSFPGRCYVPKNRYLSVDPNPNNTGTMTARRVSVMIQSTPVVLGWVAAPALAAGLGSVQTSAISATPVLRDWSSDGTIHISGCHVSGARTYRIEATTDTFNFSPALELRTTDQWGDVVGGITGGVASPPQGIANLVDAQQIVKGFQGTNAAPLVWLDLEPVNINQVINLVDAQQAVKGFQGGDFFDLPGAVDPCECAGLAPCP